MAKCSTKGAILLSLLCLTQACAPAASPLAPVASLHAPTALEPQLDDTLCPSEPKGVELTAITPGIADGSIVLIDVRTPQELLTTGKIPASYNIELSDFERAFSLFDDEFQLEFGFSKPSAEQLVISCRSGRRAVQAWKDILQYGYCNSRVYYGSFLEWAATKQPIERFNVKEAL